MSHELEMFICDNMDFEDVDHGLELIEKLNDYHDKRREEQTKLLKIKINNMDETNKILQKNMKKINDELTNVNIQNNKFQEDIINLHNELNNINVENNKMKEHCNKMTTIIRKVMSVREFTNALFVKKWDKNEERLKNFDFGVLAMNTPMLKRKNITDKKGVKYALAVLHNICNDTDKGICEFYIRYNDTCHPKITPKQLVLDILDEISGLDCLEEFNLTKDRCNKLKTEAENALWLKDY